MIFVFGSNLAGRHGKGAALFAKRFHGARQGCGEGPKGWSYAIPTKDGQLNTLPLIDIAEGVNRFIEHTKSHPEQQFQVTRIGCGLAGYTDAEILPLFTQHAPLPGNCHLPGTWQQILDPATIRIIVAGGRDYGERPGDAQRLQQDLDRLRERFAGHAIEIISGCARGADTHGADWARATEDVALREFPAQWDTYGKTAGFVRNHLMAWYGTHLVAYWDGRSKGTKHMIDAAKTEGLPIWVRCY